MLGKENFESPKQDILWHIKCLTGPKHKDINSYNNFEYKYQSGEFSIL